MSAFGNVRVALVNISVSGSLVMVLLKTNPFHVVSLESPSGPLYVLSHIYCKGSGGLETVDISFCPMFLRNVHE